MPRSIATRPSKPEKRSQFLTHWFSTVWRRIKEFSTWGGGATYLYPRWMVLRALGIIFVLVFAGIIDEGSALIGPNGLVPLAGFFADWSKLYPSSIEAFLRAPSLFWFNSSPGMIGALAWGGLIASIALTVNLWPRLALAACWVCFLSFVTTWRGFSATQVDQLMLEAGLLGIPFAPAGMRPGLGVAAPPRPVVLFALRWLLFRVMFESGLMKILAGDPRWLDLTAMDGLYETAPFPTILGYFAHHLPHPFHVAEIGLTFMAELAAPLAAVLGGRRGRWLAFVTWSVFQLGIQLTNNFGWLNVASVALGILLLDDQMITHAATKLRWIPALARLERPHTLPFAGGATNPWTLHGLRIAVGLHFFLTLHAFARIWDLPSGPFSAPVGSVFKTVFDGFRSANAYTLYAVLLPARIEVEFEGSNDGGETWRAYEFKYQPQHEDQMSPFLAPRYARFEATLQVEGNRQETSPLFGLVAAHLMARPVAVTGFFRQDPFPDQAPTAIRFPVYQQTYTDLATYHRTGHFWRKSFKGYYQPALYRDRSGRIDVAASASDELRLQAEHGNARAQNQLGTAYSKGGDIEPDATKAAFWYRQAADHGLAVAQFNLGELYAKGSGVPRDRTVAAMWIRRAADQGLAEAQAKLGYLHAYGDGVPKDAREAAAWFRKAAEQGDVQSQFFLGLCHANGDGVPQDFVAAAKYYRLAAGGGHILAQANLGFLYSRGQGVPRDDIEALAWFMVAARSGNQETIKILGAHASPMDAGRTARAQARSEAIVSEIEAQRPSR